MKKLSFDKLRIITFLLPLLFFVFFPKTVALADDSGSGSAMASPTPVMANDYTLPYPGILPDNPLYFFKTLRDNLIVFFISDPLKKSSFYLLQSDKRLASSWYLVKKGSSEDNLALSTLSKSTNYLSQSIDEMKTAKEAGNDVGGLLGTIRQAVQKHVSVIATITTLQGVANKGAFVSEEKRTQDLEKVVSQFSAQ